MEKEIFHVPIIDRKKFLHENLVAGFDSLDINGRDVAAGQQHGLLRYERCRADHVRRDRKSFFGDLAVIPNLLAVRLDEHVRNIAQDLLADTVVETGHNRQHDNECCHAQRNPGDGDKGNNRYEGLFALRPQITQTDKPFVAHEEFREG